jgi:hypothetical protein
VRGEIRESSKAVPPLRFATEPQKMPLYRTGISKMPEKPNRIQPGIDSHDINLMLPVMKHPAKNQTRVGLITLFSNIVF